jgi:hypothetical protein
MKKFISSMILLVVIVLLGLLLTGYMKKSSEKLVDIIEDTSDLVNSGSWDMAKKRVDGLDERWDSTEKKWGILIDHFEIDNIEMAMIKSKKYIDTKDLPLASAELDNLKFMVEHIHKKELLDLKNIF